MISLDYANQAIARPWKTLFIDLTLYFEGETLIKKVPGIKQLTICMYRTGSLLFANEAYLNISGQGEFFESNIIAESFRKLSFRNHGKTLQRCSFFDSQKLLHPGKENTILFRNNKLAEVLKRFMQLISVFKTFLCSHLRMALLCRNCWHFQVIVSF